MTDADGATYSAAIAAGVGQISGTGIRARSARGVIALGVGTVAGAVIDSYGHHAALLGLGGLLASLSLASWVALRNAHATSRGIELHGIDPPQRDEK